MWSIAVALRISGTFLIFFTFDAEAKTYYFNLNKTTNEFIIRNRLNPNNSAHNGHHYPATVYLGELRNNITRKIIKSEIYTHTLLDPEWDYNWKNITRSKLPSFVQKFYETYSRDLTGPVRFLFNVEPQNSTLLKFNISEYDINDNISDVELHFYQTVEENLLQKSMILRLYQIEKNDYVNGSSLINPDAHKLLNVIYVYEAESGWHVFKLTNALYKWTQKKDDLTLFITVSKPNEEQFHIFKDINREASRTFLILKSESSKLGSPEDSKSDVGKACRKHDLYVNFENLNWMKFIISPSGYHAYNCYGTCYKNQHSLNYIKVTSFIPELARKSLCCAPTKYSPLPIMFYDKHGNIAIKIYEDMIIANCGCR